MTNDDAIIFLMDNILDLPEVEKEPNFIEAIKSAIRALDQIDKIRNIISIHSNYIEEDVMKYKMIVEVLNNDEE